MPRFSALFAGAALLAGAALAACASAAPAPTSAPTSTTDPMTHPKHPHHDHSAHPAPSDAPGDHSGHAMQHGFKDAEEWAKSFDAPDRDSWQRPDEVLALLQITEGMTVADVGAGTGYFVRHLVHATGPRGTIIATDVEPDMIRYLGQRAGHEGWKNLHPVQVAPGETGLGAAAVDRILVVNVWHHLDDRRAYATKLAAALRPGGRLVVVDYDRDAHRGPPPEHRIAPDTLVEELRQAGLTAALARESLPEQYVIVATRAP